MICYIYYIRSACINIPRNLKQVLPRSLHVAMLRFVAAAALATCAAALPGRKTVMIWGGVSTTNETTNQARSTPISIVPPRGSTRAATQGLGGARARRADENRRQRLEGGREQDGGAGRAQSPGCCSRPSVRWQDYAQYLKKNIDSINAISPTIWHLAHDGVSLTTSCEPFASTRPSPSDAPRSPRVYPAQPPPLPRAADAAEAAAARIKKTSGVRVLPTVFDNESYNQVRPSHTTWTFFRHDCPKSPRIVVQRASMSTKWP